MSFPTLAVPEDTIKLFSLPKPIKLRPYLVGEEKLLLMAQQALEQNPKSTEVETAVKQIIARCTFGTVDPNTLPPFDLEYLFLQLRAKSVNNIIEATYRCVNDVAGDVCNTPVPVTIDIKDIRLTVPDGHSNKVMLDATTGIVLKYPTVADVLSDTVSALVACLDSVFLTNGDVFSANDQTPDEVRKYVEQFSMKQVDAIRETFFDTMPRLAHTFTFICPKCQHTEEITLQGLTSFFD